MNRRGFFRRIAGAVGLLAVAPSVKLPPPAAKPPVYGGGKVYGYTNFPVRQIDTSLAEAAGKRVAEEVERQILGIETTTMHNVTWHTFRPSHIKEQA